MQKSFRCDWRSHNALTNTSSLVNILQTCIVNYEAIKKTINQSHYIQDNDDESNQYLKKLIIINLDLDDDQNNAFVIDINNTDVEIEFFFISLDSLNDFKTIIFMLADETFKYRLITNNIILVFIFIVSASYIYTVFVELMYDDREFKNSLIDYDATIQS